MKSKLMKRLGTLVLCAALLCGGVFAANITKTIDVQYLDIKLVVDGVQVTPKDVNGAVVEPFVYNGTTYLPIRAIGETLGKEVDWDGNTRTVYVGKIPGKVSENYLYPYEKNDASSYMEDSTNYFTMMGKKYTQGLEFSSWSGAYGYYNLDGKYSSVEFDVGHIDGKRSESTLIYIYIDGEVVQEVEVTGDMQTKHVSVPVNYGLQMKIVKKERGCYGIANLRGIE